MANNGIGWISLVIFVVGSGWKRGTWGRGVYGEEGYMSIWWSLWDDFKSLSWRGIKIAR